ncbi:MAG: subclass B3 metallo-beta-lactamase [Acidobacteria bacterium]|nr:subclass B3 metallo-beta-lactamase [Acidobacteriota bacterium]MBI3423706.1 subclass B3 metallo-beta-lactamase [Acidobacteriota bacterium]
MFLCLGAQHRLAAQQSFPIEAWNKPFKPFRIIGNIHYVGTSQLACYLLTTPQGHILIDTALQESAPIVRANIEALGFKLKDIKIILSSHAHFDHVAGHADMKAATGAQVYATAADALVLESGGKKGFFPLGDYKPVKVDKVLKDGEVARLGKLALTAHLTPGHTEGNTTWTTTVEEGGKQYNVVFVGSMSINDGVHLVNFPAWPNIAEAYAKSFQTLKALPCEVFLGPHAPFFNLEAKVKLLEGNPATNPFIDPAGYQKYIAGYEKSYHEQLEKERASR